MRTCDCGMFALIYSYYLVFLQVNDARKYFFAKKERGLEGLPPPREALEQHVKCAVYQGGYVWGRATALKPVFPEPTNWGWTLGRKEELQPQSVMPLAAAVICKELVHCGCKKSFSRKCKLLCKGRPSMYPALYM